MRLREWKILCFEAALAIATWSQVEEVKVNYLRKKNLSRLVSWVDVSDKKKDVMKEIRPRKKS